MLKPDLPTLQRFSARLSLSHVTGDLKFSVQGLGILVIQVHEARSLLDQHLSAPELEVTGPTGSCASCSPAAGLANLRSQGLAEYCVAFFGGVVPNEAPPSSALRPSKRISLFKCKALLTHKKPGILKLQPHGETQRKLFHKKP